MTTGSHCSPSMGQLSRRQLLICGCLPWLSPRAWGQSGKPVRVVVPFAAGAGTDAMGRLLAQKLGDLLGQTFVVDNRSGASGAIGTQHVAQSPPDGHTLLLIAAPFTTVPAVLPTAGYDPVGSFEPISMVAQGPLVWACNKNLPVHTLAELAVYARTRPGQLNYGSAGAGGINHLVLEQFKARAGVSIVHIPYRGVAPAVLDMVAGQIDLGTGTVPALAPFIRESRIRALAVTTPKRSPALPEVPGLAESGMNELTALNYFGLVAPKGTPVAIIDRIHQTLPPLLALPDVQARLHTDALEISPTGPEHLTQFIRQDYESWKKVVVKQGIRVEQV